MTFVAGLVILAATFVALKSVLPKDGRNHPLVDHPIFGGGVPLGITIGFAIGLGFVIAGLV